VEQAGTMGKRPDGPGHDRPPLDRIFGSIAVCATKADRPLPRPAKVSAHSSNGRFRAVSDPQGDTRVEDLT
jgi:hypothetical protein